MKLEADNKWMPEAPVEGAVYGIAYEGSPVVMVPLQCVAIAEVAAAHRANPNLRAKPICWATTPEGRGLVWPVPDMSYDLVVLK